jgi:hypothetical protein
MADTSLKAISSRVKLELETRRHTSIPELTAAIISDYKSQWDSVPDDTIRRRVYDVVTVFIVIGYVQKSQKTLDWVGKVPSDDPSVPAQIATISRSVEHKQELLRHKLRLLFLYRALITANRTSSRPNNAIPFPTIVLGGKRHITVRKDSDRQLTIECPRLPEVFSPVEILMGRGFTHEEIAIVKESLPKAPIVMQLLGQ